MPHGVDPIFYDCSNSLDLKERVWRWNLHTVPELDGVSPPLERAHLSTHAFRLAGERADLEEIAAATTDTAHPHTPPPAATAKPTEASIPKK